MLLTTSENIAGKQLTQIGIVTGNVVQAKHIGRDMMAGLKSLVGGEIKGYTELLNESRNTATNRLVAEATKLGADAVVCLRYNSAAVMDGACEVMAYGTAVRFS
ncbi:MAG: heavy metal-binding domain-containing protein [Treponema sp.]|nr:heavy metal-binding domain-containing protein [Treponema sp.]